MTASYSSFPARRIAPIACTSHRTPITPASYTLQSPSLFSSDTRLAEMVALLAGTPVREYKPRTKKAKKSLALRRFSWEA